MSSEQRYRLEEYHDPDYSQFHIPKEEPEARPVNDAGSTPKQKPSPVDRRTSIVQVIRREFQRELDSKEQELDEINKRLSDARKLMAKVRFAVVSHYYGKKSLNANSEDIQTVIESSHNTMTPLPSTTSDKLQMPIHPSLKKLLGKRPIDYNEILKNRPTRKAAKNATEQFQKLVKKSATETKAKQQMDLTEAARTGCDDKAGEPVKKKPRYIGPNIIKPIIEPINSSRGRNHYRHLLVVGNVSRFIADEEAELGTNVTHKWMVYIATKTKVPIEQILKRARFHLHDSYKPNDIIDVTYPPFQLSKRGWGEFPLRIQLFFHDHLGQKPLQIFHTLVLDKKHTGLQTMGAETIVELWLNIPADDLPKTSEVTLPSEAPTAIEMTTTLEPQTNEIPQASAVLPATNANESIGISIKEERLENLPEYTIPMVSTPGNLDTSQNQTIQNPQINGSDHVHIQNDHEEPSTSNQLPAPIQSKSGNPIQVKLSSSMIKSTGDVGSSGKKFMKCINKNGEVSYVQLLQDPNNPKVFKMIVPKQVTIAKNSVPAKLSENGGSLEPPASLEHTQSIVNANVPSVSTIRKIIPIDSNQLPSYQQQPKIIQPIQPAQLQFSVAKHSQQQQIARKLSQQSLLRPQISLLKPTQSANKTPIKMITVNNIAGLANKNINVFMPPNLPSSMDRNDLRAIKSIEEVHVEPPKEVRNVAFELEVEFLKKPFSNMTNAVSWLFKRLPLISLDCDYRKAFAFATATLGEFQSFHLGKRRCFEWLRAKQINRLVLKHKHCTALPKWSTKEIVQYGRWHAYTPISCFETVKSKSNEDKNVQEIVKSELEREQLHTNVISFNTQLTNWLQATESETKPLQRHIMDNELINVDECSNDDEEHSKQSKIHKMPKSSNHATPLSLNTELLWINDICRRSQINLQPEETNEGESHRGAEIAMATALRSFTDHLLRKCVANRLRCNSGANMEISADDIIHVISQIPQFDFLTNKNLGIESKNAS